MNNWPQIVYLLLLFAGTLLAAHRHGKEKEGVHNFWTDISATTIVCWILWEGGFFKPLFG